MKTLQNEEYFRKNWYKQCGVCSVHTAHMPVKADCS